MSQTKIIQIKNDKGFRFTDLIVYAVIVVLIVGLFIGFGFFSKQGEQLTKIEVLQYNKRVFIYDFDKDEYTILAPDRIEVIENSPSALKFKCYKDEKQEHFNTIEIYKGDAFKQGRSVDVTKANCSERMDCVYMAKIEDTADEIICTPHALKVRPIGYDNNKDNSDIIV